MAKADYEIVCWECGNKIGLLHIDETEANRPQAESSAIGSSAAGAATPVPSESGVQPAGPSQLKVIKQFLENRLLRCNISGMSPFREERRMSQFAAYRDCYDLVVRMIEGEVGENHDGSSRPAG
jgi:hypothetical protein